MAKLRDKKEVYFGLAGAIGGLVASGVYNMLDPDTPILTWITGFAFVCVAVSMLLVVAQDRYLNRSSFSRQALVKAAVISVVGGVLGGIVASKVGFSIANMLGLGEDSGRFIGWTIAGVVVGLATATGVPNLKRKHAMLGGGGGGLAGCAAMYLLNQSLTAGFAVQGMAIGVAVAVAEAVFRKVWLEFEILPVSAGVSLEKSIQRTIALGEQSIVFGTSEKANIALARGVGYPDVAAILEVKGGRIVLEDRISNRNYDLKNGSKGKVGNVEFVVREALAR